MKNLEEKKLLVQMAQMLGEPVDPLLLESIEKEEQLSKIMFGEEAEPILEECDGTGLSGFNLDVTKTQLAFIDFQWLGVGRVRCGFAHNGKLIVAHEFNHSNVLDEVYIANPNLPVRCEVRNTGAGTGGSMDQICSTVVSEGGYIESGIDFALTANSRTTATPSATPLPLEIGRAHV